MIENIYNTINSNASNEYIAIFAISILILYKTISSKIKIMPKIPVTLLIIYLLLRVTTNYLEALGLPLIQKWIDISATAALYCGVARIIFYFTVEKTIKIFKNKTIPRITKDFLLLIIYSGVVIIILGTKGNVNLAGLITTSAMMTAVIGLAAQRTLSNFFAGIFIQMDGPCKIGDWIEYNGTVGEVISVSWELTKIKNREQEVLSIPNQEIISQSIKNFSHFNHIATFKIGVDYPTPPNKLKSTLMKILEEDSAILKDPPPKIILNDFSDFSIVYTVRFAHKDFKTEGLTIDRIKTKIWYALKRDGIEIPFPIRRIQDEEDERSKKIIGKKLEFEQSKKIIGSIDLFSSIDENAITEIAAHAKVEYYAEGEIVVKQNEAGSSMYILEEGELKVTIKGEGANEIEVARLKEKSFFGEMSLLTGAPRSATVSSLTDSKLIRIDKEIFAKLIAVNPSISQSLANILSERVEANEKRVTDTTEIKNKKKQILERILRFFGK